MAVNIAPPTPGPTATPPGTDTLFKRLVTLFTALCLMLAYGWLAGFVRQPNGDVTFQWRWPIVAWALVGLGTSIWFWRKVWPPENRPPATRKDIVIGSIVLGLPGLWWITFPLHFLSGQHFWDVIEGLIAAAIVLSGGAWAVTRLGKAFESDDPGGLDVPAARNSSATGTRDSKK